MKGLLFRLRRWFCELSERGIFVGVHFVFPRDPRFAKPEAIMVLDGVHVVHDVMGD
jgi:hypothetical protein